MEHVDSHQFRRQIVHKLIATLEIELTIFEPVLLHGQGQIFINKNFIVRPNFKMTINLCTICLGNCCVSIVYKVFLKAVPINKIDLIFIELVSIFSAIWSRCGSHFVSYYAWGIWELQKKSPGSQRLLVYFSHKMRSYDIRFIMRKLGSPNWNS